MCTHVELLDDIRYEFRLHLVSHSSVVLNVVAAFFASLFFLLYFEVWETPPPYFRYKPEEKVKGSLKNAFFL